MGSSTMKSILSLNDGSPSLLNSHSHSWVVIIFFRELSDNLLLHLYWLECNLNIGQFPSRVADARPRPTKSFSDNTPSSNVYQHLHICVESEQPVLTRPFCHLYPHVVSFAFQILVELI